MYFLFSKWNFKLTFWNNVVDERTSLSYNSYHNVDRCQQRMLLIFQFVLCQRKRTVNACIAHLFRCFPWKEFCLVCYAVMHVRWHRMNFIFVVTATCTMFFFPSSFHSFNLFHSLPFGFFAFRQKQQKGFSWYEIFHSFAQFIVDQLAI